MSEHKVRLSSLGNQWPYPTFIYFHFPYDIKCVSLIFSFSGTILTQVILQLALGNSLASWLQYWQNCTIYSLLASKDISPLINLFLLVSNLTLYRMICNRDKSSPALLMLRRKMWAWKAILHIPRWYQPSPGKRIMEHSQINFMVICSILESHQAQASKLKLYHSVFAAQVNEKWAYSPPSNDK